jgi:hypothetical protein
VGLRAVLPKSLDLASSSGIFARNVEVRTIDGFDPHGTANDTLIFQGSTSVIVKDSDVSNISLTLKEIPLPPKPKSGDDK